MNNKYNVYSKFDIQKHKETFINYLEVCIDIDGTINYAVPSHQEYMINKGMLKHNCTRQQYYDMCPKEYYGDYLNWLSQDTQIIVVWGNNGYMGIPNKKQKEAIKLLQDEGLLKL